MADLKTSGGDSHHATWVLQLTPDVTYTRKDLDGWGDAVGSRVDRLVVNGEWMITTTTSAATTTTTAAAIMEAIDLASSVHYFFCPFSLPVIRQQEVRHTHGHSPRD